MQRDDERKRTRAFRRVRDEGARAATMFEAALLVTFGRRWAVSARPADGSGEREAHERCGKSCAPGHSRKSVAPQWKPAPRPTKQTRSPFLMRPDFLHSSYAIGIVAAVVFP